MVHYLHERLHVGSETRRELANRPARVVAHRFVPRVQVVGGNLDELLRVRFDARLQKR